MSDTTMMKKEQMPVPKKFFILLYFKFVSNNPGNFAVNKIEAILLSLILFTCCIAEGQTRHIPALRTTAGRPKLSILLLLNNNSGTQNTADGASVLFDDNFSADIGPEDSKKFTNADENLAIIRNGTVLSIEGRPVIISKDTIPLRIWQYRQTDYLLKLQGSNFADSLTAVIKDAYLNTETAVNLASATLFSFTVSSVPASSADNRFSIIFRSGSIPATVTVSPADVTVCGGSNTVFNVAATGFYLTYRWQVSTDSGHTFSNTSDGVLYSGSSTSSVSVSGVSNVMKGWQYRVIVNGVSPVSADTSDASTLTIANTWTGNNGTDWANAANWVCNGVPALTDDVVIPGSATRMPVLAGNASVGSLTLKTGSSVSLNGQAFTINGIVSGTGLISGSLSSSLTINGSGNVNFAGGNNLLKNLTVNSAATVELEGDMDIAGTLHVTAGTFALNNHTVTLKAGTEGGVNFPNTTVYPATAIVAPVTGTITYGTSGKFVSERYIPAGTRAFRFISSPVNAGTSIRTNWMENGSNMPGYGTHITGYAGSAGGFDPTATNNPSLFTYNNATQGWTDIKTTAAALNTNNAYRLFFRGDRTINLSTNTPAATATILRTAGELITGNVTYNAPFLNGVTGGNRFNFVGNPYHSPVSWFSLTKTNINSTYWVWDANMSTRGAYVYYIYYTDANGNLLYGINNTNGASKVDDNIQPGQAFFVQSTGASPVLAIIEANKTNGTTPVFRTASDITKLSVQLLLNRNGSSADIADAAIAVFDDAFTSSVGRDDAIKFTNQDENFAINRNDTALSIEGRPQVKAQDTLLLKMWQFRQKNYFLKIDASNFLASMTAFVKDAYLKTETAVNLADSTFIPFSITTDSASFAPNRFMIVFKTSGVLPVTLTDVKAYQKEKGIQVDWISRTETNINYYEVEKSYDGRQFEKTALLAAKGNNSATVSYGWFDETPVEGANFYRIKVIEKSGAVKYTQVVKVTIGKAGSSFTVYPNPVKGNTISLHLVNMPKGKYNINLYNGLGQRILSKVIVHDGLSANYTISTERVMSKGAYRLNAVNGDSEINTTVMFE